MSVFEFNKTKAFLAIFCSFLPVSISIYSEESYSLESFSTDSLYEGSVEDNSIAKDRVYTLNQLETLKKAISPRYIRYIDWSSYGTRHGVLKKGILFTYEGYHLKNVFLSGNFNNWGLLDLKRNLHGVYFTVIPVKPDFKGKNISRYHYKYFADGIWTHDPENRYKFDDGLGGYYSEYFLDGVDIERQITVRIIKEAGMSPVNERLVEFAIYLPEVSNLSIAGSFNHWNPEHDILEKDKNGIFRLKMRLKPGEYTYRYIADGNWILDTYNPETRYHSFIKDLCSYIKID